MLLKKSYDDKRKRHKQRNWKLKSLNKDVELAGTENGEKDYLEFMDNLEEDQGYRQNVNIYHGKKMQRLVFGCDIHDTFQILSVKK